MSDFQFDTDLLTEICHKNNVASIGVFGSVAKGQTSETSDIDLLVRFNKKVSLMAVVKLERELSTAFGKKVDLLTESALSPYLREQVLDDLKVIYDEGYV